MKRLSQILLMVGVAAGAFYLVLRGVRWTGPPEEPGVKQALEYVLEDGLWLFLGGVLLFGGLHLTRSIRWGRLIQAMRPDVRFRSYFSICSIGFLLINILPFRLGEFARPYLLYDKEDVPFGSGMATVLVERVLDVLALGFILVGVLLFANVGEFTVDSDFDGIKDFDLVAAGRVGLLGVGIPFGGGLVLLLLLGERGVAIARRVFSLFGARVSRLIVGFLEGFLESVRALGSAKAMVSVLLWTVIAWGVNIASMWCMAMGFGLDVGFWDGAAILLSICIVLIIPPTPGFVGVFELGVVIGFALYDQPKELAVAFGLVVHLFQFLILASLGSVFLVLDKVSMGGILRGINELRATQGAGGGDGG